MKKRKYTEAELIKLFNLKRLVDTNATDAMKTWLDTTTVLSSGEQELFDKIILNLSQKIAFWNEEMLKMNFIAFVIHLGNLIETDRYKTYYESNMEGEVEGHYLKVRADMMVASGVLDVPETPYFYFQEYKKLKDPQGDVAAQLLEAMLIAQAQNTNKKTIYGCTVSGRDWEFVTLYQKTYCISQSYNCTKKDDLLQIIAILRKFKVILETELLD